MHSAVCTFARRELSCSDRELPELLMSEAEFHSVTGEVCGNQPDQYQAWLCVEHPEAYRSFAGGNSSHS